VLTGWDHAHIHVLLMRSLYLLLLLLQQLYLLLYRELFHWEAVSDGLADIDDGISMTTTVGVGRANRNGRENSLPGEENILIRGVNSDGLLR
jgi:hypothetical protein